MTSYYAFSDGSELAIRAVTYEIRIASVNLMCYAGGIELVTTHRHEVSSLGGGTAADVAPLYQGAPAATATARSGTSALTFSGTDRIVGSAFVPQGNSTAVIGLYTVVTQHGSNAQIQTPLTLTVAPGSVYHVKGITTGTVVQVFFEELRLVGSY
jgi:hypothetical protein